MHISMHLIIYLTVWYCKLTSIAAESFEQEVAVQESTNPLELTKKLCVNSRNTCSNFVHPIIELQKFHLYNTELKDWVPSAACGCMLPPQLKLPHLQYFHIPKCGTSLNWFLRDYFDNCDIQSPNEAHSNDPCPSWLENVSLLCAPY